MGDSQMYSASIMHDAIRLFLSFFDYIAFGLLGIMYQIFFNVSSADIFANETMMKFYGRVQMIIGVFMMFQFAMSILRGIMNPDNFFGGKDGGEGGKLIMRIVTALFMLAILVPISIPSPRNEYEKQIRNNGLLFGTLYSLQHRILANNTIGRLVLGTSDTSTNYVKFGANNSDNLKTSSRIFTSTILKGFYRINLLPENQRPKHDDTKDDSVFNENRVCQDIDDPILNAYTKLDADPWEIISMVNLSCASNGKKLTALQNLLKVKKLTGKTRYIFAYSGFFSMIVALIFVFILLSFSVDVAVRSVKLAILRLIAPIPIISYMDPKGSKDSSFNSWVKTLTSTYIDLFIRLASVYFVIYMIQDMIVHGVVINTGSGLVGIASLIIIWIGLFIFAKQSPKFIKQVLGLKDDAGAGFFSGLGGIVAAAGVVGSARANWRAADEEGEALNRGPVWRRVVNAGSAIAGGIAGGYKGIDAMAGKNPGIKSVLDAQSQRNAQRASHSTLPGRIADSAYGAFTGRSLATRDQGRLDANKAAASSIKAFKTTAVEEAMKKGDYGTVSAAKDRFHRLQGIQFNYRELEAAMGTKDTSGNFDYTDRQGNVHHLNTAWFDTGVMADIEDSQTASYLRSDWEIGVRAGKNGFDNDKINTDWRNARHDMGEAGLNYTGNYLGDISVNPGAYSDIGKTIGAANRNVTDMSTDMRHIMHRANNQQKK